MQIRLGYVNGFTPLDQEKDQDRAPNGLSGGAGARFKKNTH